MLISAQKLSALVLRCSKPLEHLDHVINAAGLDSGAELSAHTLGPVQLARVAPQALRDFAPLGLSPAKITCVFLSLYTLVFIRYP